MFDDQTRFASLTQLTARTYDVRVLRVTTRSGSSYTVGLLAGPKKTVILRGNSKDGTRIEVRDPGGQLEDGRGLFDVAPEAWVGASLEVGSIATSRIVKVEDEQDDREVTAIRGLSGAGRAPAPTPEAPSRTSRPASVTSNPAAPLIVREVGPLASRPPEPTGPKAAPLLAREFRPRAWPQPSAVTHRQPSPAYVQEAAPPVSRPPSAAAPSKPAAPPVDASVRPAAYGQRPTTYAEDFVEDLEDAAACLRAAYRERDLVYDLKATPELEERYALALGEIAQMIQAIGRRMRDEGG